MITIIALFDIQSHDSPVAIGAPMHGETGLQMGQTPNISVNQDNNLQKMKRSPCCGGGDGRIRAGGQRCSLAKVQLGNPGLKPYSPP